MIFLIDYCTFPWLLAWLLPFLLGLLLGWLLWGRFKALLRKCEDDLAACRKTGSQLEEDLAECRKSYSTLENENATLRGKIRELEVAIKEADSDIDLSSSISADVGTPDVDLSSSISADVDAPDVDLSSNISADVDTPDLSSSISADVDTPDIDLSSSFAASGASGAVVSSDGAVKIGSDDMYAALKVDNLQVVEGIGPKMESVLKDNGLHTWSDLASKSGAELKAILSSEKYGRKYQIIDPGTWADQAALARDGNWDRLITMQKALDTGRVTSNSETDSKVEKLLIKLGVLRKFKKDDLKVVEGIGPKIEQLMHNGGITTWAEMAAASVERLQQILDSAGDRFRLADPGTWPKQAGMAEAGQWKELDEYQDFLQGGKE